MWFFGKKKRVKELKQVEKRKLEVEEIRVETTEPINDNKQIANPEPVIDSEISLEDNVILKDDSSSLDSFNVMLHPQGGWQVIKNQSKRARRRFDTQAQCIEFCKTNELDYIVYKKDGTIKK